jgi:hypothetical protein
MIYIDCPDLLKAIAKLQRMAELAKNKVDKIPDHITRIVASGANDIRNTILESMRNTSKAPWFYLRGKSKRVKDTTSGEMRRARHYPSMPGDPPAVDSGQLIRTIMWRQNADKSIEVGAIGGTTGKKGVSYAVVLENSKNKKMKRPFLKPAVDKHIKGIIKQVEDYTSGIMTVVGKEGE